MGIVTIGTPEQIAVQGEEVPFSSSLMSSFGEIDFDAIDDAVIQNYCSIALGRLAEQFKNKPLLAAIICSFTAEVQQIEYMLIDLLIERSIDGSIGQQLTNVGTIVGEFRPVPNTPPDTEYRAAIKAQIGFNYSSGTAENIIAFVKDATNSSFVLFYEVFPAKVYIITNGSLAPAALVADTKEVAMGGVGVEIASGYGSTLLFAFITEGGLPAIPTHGGYAEKDYPATVGGTYTEKL